jgi:glycosyltransferase involved in cell wall biosynthesis
MKRWTTLHKNCREHYATPRILACMGLLDRMITDVWVPPALQKWMPSSLRSRWHAELMNSAVTAFNARVLPRRLWERFANEPWWKRIEAEDLRFQEMAAKAMKKKVRNQPPGICFSYSYSGLEALRVAKKAGWKAVLGQIDPGPLEWEIVRHGSRQYVTLEPAGERPSEAYWKRWREETELADLIIANSEWSASLLRQQGIPEGKLRVIPLLYDNKELFSTPKVYPESFTQERPLRLLFLGRLCLRKGVPQLLDAVKGLGDEQIELRLVGPLAMELPTWTKQDPWARKIQVHPPVGGEGVNAAYDWADVFILPTLSDGFAITQLEALARRVPVIVSDRCARVVRHCENGWVLDEVTPEAIQDSLRYVLRDPKELLRWSCSAEVPESCQKENLQQKYLALTEELSKEGGKHQKRPLNF